MPGEFPHPHLFYPELLDIDIIVSSINYVEDIRRNFLFCLDLNLNGLLTFSVEKSWPFKHLLIPLNHKKGAKGILLVKNKDSQKEFLLRAENAIRKLSYKNFLFADPDASCKDAHSDRSLNALIEEISYRTGKKIIYLSGGKNG